MNAHARLYSTIFLINTLNTKFASILSIALHPLLMPTLVFAIVFYVAPHTIHDLESFNLSARVGLMSLKMGLLLLIFLQTFVVPLLVIYILYRMGHISSLQMETLQERRLPYLATMIIYTFIAAFYTKNIKQFPEVALLLSISTFSIAIVSFISLYWKISAHAVGICGAIGALLGLAVKFKENQLFFPLLLLVLLAGWLNSARLHLNAHTLAQVIAGDALGFGIGFGIVWLFF